MALNPLLPLLALGALGALAFSKKSSAAAPGGGGHAPAPQPSLPATPAPSGAASQTVSINGHVWKLVPVSGGAVDVFAPAGSWGPHGELRVLRFSQAKTSGAPRVLAGVAEGVPKAVLDAAMKDLAIKTPAGPVLTAPPGKPPMPPSLQAELVAAMMGLGVDAGGTVRGPVTAEAIRNATELSSRLEKLGYPEAAAELRRYAQAAGKLLPPPPPSTPAAPAIPGVPPAMMQQIQRALELERDPAKLEALRNSLRVLPPSAERDLLIGALDALILQVRAAQAVSTAATEIEQMTTPAAVMPTGVRLLKLTKPNMNGPDVKAWQSNLVASGYKIDPDGFFGPGTEAATKDWQKKRGLDADGIVGPATLAKVGTPPTAPLGVPATASPRPDPAPKSSLQVAAESLATHLLALQAKHGVTGSKGRQDTTLVKRFQTLAGGAADGFPGVGTMLALARAGVGLLPMVMYWPKAGTKAKDLPAYRQQLTAIAQAARSAGNPALALALEASALRESGAGGLS